MTSLSWILAPGSSHNVADFAIIAQKSLLVTTAEVTSLMNAYSFIKAALFRRLTLFFKHAKASDLLELLEMAKESDHHPELKTMEGFFQKAHKVNSAVAESARKSVSNFKPVLVINRVRTRKDVSAGDVLRNLMKQFLSIESALIMTIREDDAVGTAIAKLKPVMMEAPDSPFSKDLKAVAVRLCQQSGR